MVKKRQNRNSIIQEECKKIVLKDFKDKKINIVFLPVLYPNMNCAIMATKEAMIRGNVTIICRNSKKTQKQESQKCRYRRGDKGKIEEKEKERQRERQRRRDSRRDRRGYKKK